MNRNYVAWAAILTLGSALSSTPAAAQTAPTLGTAEPFAVLGGSAVTNTGPSVINGSLGLSPGSAITGFPPGIVVGTIHAADAVALQAQNDTVTAYNALASQSCTTDLTGQDLGGLTLTPGTYCFAAGAALTGTLTLNAQGNPGAVFIFRTGSTLVTASGSSVSIINGGSPCNVFWQVGSSATLGTSTSMSGTIIAMTSITLTTATTLAGRALARNGAVTLDSNTVTRPVCSLGPPGCPVIGIQPAPLPAATQGIAFNQQLTGSGGAAPYTFTLRSGTLPAGLSLTAAGLLSGTPSTPGAPAFTIRATDVNGCFQEVAYVFTVLAAVPTLGQWAMITLTALLSIGGFMTLRRRQLTHV
jgi:hypothetical protein